MSTTRSSSRPRRWSSAGLVAALAVAGALAGAGAPSQAVAGGAPDLIHTHRVLSVECLPGPSNTVRARVRVRMVVVNYEGFGGDWADRMEAKARLVPTSAGLNFTRSWRSQKTSYLGINRKHRYDFTVITDNVSGTRAWKLQLKLIWHRSLPSRNISINRHLAFNPGCAAVTGGGVGIGIGPAWSPVGS
jgi:hypothetical protein